MLLLSYVLSKAAYLFHGFRKFSTKYLDKYFFLFYSRRGGVWIDARKKDKNRKKSGQKSSGVKRVLNFFLQKVKYVTLVTMDLKQRINKKTS